MSEKTTKNKNNRSKFILIVIGGIVGVLLLIFGNTLDRDDAATVSEEESSVSEPSDADAYAAMIEARVAQICSQVSGAGSVEVFVSLKGGYRTVYAIDSQSTSSGYKNEVVMSGSGADKRAVITAYENPEISGVAIVCSGAENDGVRTQIISLVSAALDIGTNKIFVADS